MEACERLASKLRDEHSCVLGVEDLCRIGYMAIVALKPLLGKLGVSPSSLSTLELDFEGPRIIVKSAGSDFEAYLDISPDGVEEVVTLKQPLEAPLDEVEEAIARTIEEGEEFQGVEEYDVSCSRDGVTITLYSKLLEDLPDMQAIRKAVERALLSI